MKLTFPALVFLSGISFAQSPDSIYTPFSGGSFAFFSSDTDMVLQELHLVDTVLGKSVLDIYVFKSIQKMIDPHHFEIQVTYGGWNFMDVLFTFTDSCYTASISKINEINVGICPIFMNKNERRMIVLAQNLFMSKDEKSYNAFVGLTEKQKANTLMLESGLYALLYNFKILTSPNFNNAKLIENTSANQIHHCK